ncbi:MAG: hypothetical protein KDB02_06840 [Acidimicrobiales bacterium]|nr:hypothetical protein [Acidimicrobiales bacterium]MCB1247014.1 hypothetical protein [Acidimicrobiia bacterium]
MIRIADLKVSVVGVLVAASALAFTGGVASAAPSTTYRCNGGEIPSGNYRSIVVAGPCAVGADAVINVRGSITVLRGAIFDAQSAPATINVGGSVTAFSGSMVGLGCQPPDYTGNSAHPCEIEPTGHSNITIRRNVTIFGAVGVFLNGLEIGGNVTVLGGGSDIPWSIKNNTIHGNLTVAGQTEEWIGILFNRVDRNVTLLGITMTGLDDETGTGTNPVFVVRNDMGRNLLCFWNDPGVTGYGNNISRHALGQCAPLAGGGSPA